MNDLTDDNVINAEEAAGQVTVSGKVEGEFREGDVVTLTINDEEYTATVAADGTWRVDVPGSELVADDDSTIAGRVVVSDAAGNATTAEATKAYEVDTVAPGDTNGDGTVDTLPVVTVPEA
ncbi:Ig-like domain-containing protein, partial [Oligella urethralis]